MDPHELLSALLKDQAHLLGSLDQSELVRARGLIQNLIGLWVLIHHNCVADGQKAEEVEEPASFIIVRPLASILVEGFCHEALDNLDRTFDHTCVIIHSVVDVLVSQMAIDVDSNLTFLELHFVLRERTGLVREYEFNLTKLFDQVTIAA